MFVNLKNLDPKSLEKFQGWQKTTDQKLDVPTARLIPNLLQEKEIGALQKELSKHAWIPVGLDGILANYNPNDPIGSWRLSIYTPELSQIFFERLMTYLPMVRKFDSQIFTDWDNHFIWQAVGVNPLMRFIRYKPGGLLVPHYDAPYIQDDKTRSLVTVVIYLEHNADGGHTRFLHDPQDNQSFKKRDFRDWQNSAKDEDIKLSVNPTPGSALVFDHRILHDSEQITHGEKTILRTDILYEKI